MDGREEALADAQQRASLARRVHHLKNDIYAGIVHRGELPLRTGVAELLADCSRAGLPMGIATTTTRANLEALLVTSAEHPFARAVPGCRGVALLHP